VNPDIKALIHLQEIDIKILELDKQIQNVPAQIQNIQQSLDTGIARVAVIKEALAEKQKIRRKAEMDVEALRTKLAKLKDQLMTVKTNKEYTAMLKEIEVCDHDIRKAEDSILEIMESLDILESDLKKITQEVRLESDGHLGQRGQLENLLSTHQSARDSLLAAKSEIEKNISFELLDRYRKVASVRKGIALAEARDECCMGCRVRLRPQVSNDVRRNDLILTCDSCGRILFWIAPPPAPPAQQPSPPSVPTATEASAAS
jgi:predicted  nucleic acid-binding Zn-ribbon protein